MPRVAVRPRAVAPLWALIACLAVACECDDEKPGAAPASSARRAHPAFEQAASFARRLRAMRGALDDPSKLSESPCDDRAVRERLGSEAGKLLTADHGYLERYAPPKHAPQSPRGAETGERWRFLTTPALRKVPGPVELESKRAAVDAAYRIKQLEERYRYAAVIRVTERQMPAEQGDRFEGGRFEATVAIFDLASADRLCQARVVATSSVQVAAREKTSQEDALWNDFRMTIRHALDDGVRRITRHLSLDLG